MGSLNTFPHLFDDICQTEASQTALVSKVDGIWKPVSYGELNALRLNFAKALFVCGVEKGERIALMLPNSPEWVVCDIGSQTLGVVDVPLYSSLSSEEAKHILNDSSSALVVISGKEQIRKLEEIKENLPELRLVIYIDEKPNLSEKIKTISYKDFLFKGESLKEDSERDFFKLTQAISGDDLASIVYSSGTTGKAKGVALTQRNFMANVEGILDRLTVYGIKKDNQHKADIHLSFLPLSHAFERTAGYYTILSAGATIYYAESIDKISDNFLEVKPTVVISVPRLFEKMIAKIKEKVAKASPMKQKLFNWALAQGLEFDDANQTGKVPLLLKLKQVIAEKLVFKKIAEKFGGRIRFFVSGGAPLSRETGLFFRSIGIKVLEGYGLTETSPVIAFNPLEDTRGGSVGPPLKNVETKILDDGELLVRGESISKGYFNNEEATKEAFDKDGWFHTGDIVKTDPDGYISITDRKKDIFVMSNGKNVAPQVVEARLLSDDFIAQAVAIGNNRNFISALLVPNFTWLKNESGKAGVSVGKDETDLAITKNESVIKFYKKRVKKLMEGLSRYETVKEFRLLAEEFTQEGGELTPTLKIKRKVVLKKYESIIENIYQSATRDNIAKR